MPFLLDTCAIIWLVNGDAVTDDCRTALRGARDNGDAVYISPISAWEIGLLVARGRLSLLLSPLRWFDRVLHISGAQLSDMPPDILIASSYLPGDAPRDPADRILAATAREYGCVLVTRDRALLDYAAQGHVQSIEC
jgi:PIN domain nuclease of toxin-antitoxin system